MILDCLEVWIEFFFGPDESARGCAPASRMRARPHMSTHENLKAPMLAPLALLSAQGVPASASPMLRT